MRTVFFLSLVAVAQILGIARVEAKNSLRVDDVLATRSPLVWVLATVRDTHGLPIPDLGVEDFRVLEETGTEGLKPLKVLSAPLSGVDICLAIDSSRQMIGPPLAMARVAGIRLVDNLTENDRVAVVAFTDGVDFSKPIPQFDEKKEIDFTDDRFALRKVINRQYGRGNCPLYDGLAKAIAVTFRQPVGNRAIILFSQGNDAALGGPPDSGSRFYEPKAPITGATRAGIPIYTIGIGHSVNRPYLEGLAMITGGEYLETPSPNELALFLRETVLRLKQQYLIVYSSTRVDRTGPFQVSLKLGQGEDAIEEASEVALGEIQDGSGSPFIPPSLEARMGEDMPEEMAASLDSLAAGALPVDATTLQSLAGQIPGGTGALSATALQSLASQIPGGAGALSATALQNLASQIPGGTGALSATTLQSLASQIPGGTGALSATALQSLAGQIPGGTGALSATALQNLAEQLSAGTGVMDATAMEALALQMSAAKKAREEDTSFAGRMAAFVQDNDQELAIAVGTFLLILMLSVIILKGGRKRRQLTEWSEDESVGVPSIGVYPGSTQIAEDPQPTGPTEASTSSPPSQSKESTLERTLLASALDDSAEETLGETDIIPPPQKDVAFLDVKEGPVSLEAPFRITRNITIGRHPDSDLHLDHATVSRKHARIVLQDLVFTIEDLGSGNGTHLNGLPVIAATPLTNGDEIKMGEVVLVFRR